MLIEAIRNNLNQGIEKLRDELLSYEQDEELWLESDGIKNPAGTLVLHLCGNLRHYIGAKLGHTMYVRDRPAEFSTRGLTRNDLLLELADTDKVVGKVLNILNESDLIEPFPTNDFGEKVTILEVLLQLISHFNYHLGQVNYHRRILSHNPVTEG